MPSPPRRPLFLVASALLALVPVAFGVIRAVSTGTDLRYIWLAGAAIIGSMAVGLIGVSPGPARVPVWRAVGAVAAGTICAGATAILLMGAKVGPGIAIVALSFGLCTGASAVFAGLARHLQAS